MRKTVQRSWVTALCVAACSSVLFAADGQADPAKVFDGQIKMVENEFVSLAEAMPANRYSFAPTKGEFKGVRSFADQVKHVASVTYLVAAALRGEKPPVDTGGETGPASAKTKDEIVKYAKDAFAYAHTAVGTLTAGNLLGEIDSPFGEGKTSRLDAANILAWHAFDHYGQMVVYARMNGIVPPASRK